LVLFGTIYCVIAVAAGVRDQKKYKQESQECGGTNPKHHSSPDSSCNMRKRSRFQLGAEYSVLSDQCAFHIVAPRRRYVLVLIV
jgi:hypothetical protein